MYVVLNILYFNVFIIITCTCILLQDPAGLHHRFIEECFMRLESLTEQRDDLDQLAYNIIDNTCITYTCS